jgi:hypothetical protein
MADELSRGGPTSRYPMLSGLLLLSVPVSCLLSYLIAGEYTWLNAIALLIIPLAVFSWIFYDDQSNPRRWREVLVHSLYIRCLSRRCHRSPDVLDHGPLYS